MTVQGEGKAADTDYSGDNIKTFIKQDAATGNTTIDVKMNKNLKAESVKVGKDGKDGVSLTGPDAANGTDGKVAVTDKNGKDAVSMSGKDGVGHIGLSGKDGKSVDITAEKALLISMEMKSRALNTKMKMAQPMKWQAKMMVWHTVATPVLPSRRNLNEQLDIKGGVNQ